MPSLWRWRLHSPHDPNLLPPGAVLLDPPRVCEECGSPGQADAPLYESPWGWLCSICAEAKAVSILAGGKPGRAERRRQEFHAKHSAGSRNRKRKRKRR